MVSIAFVSFLHSFVLKEYQEMFDSVRKLKWFSKFIMVFNSYGHAEVIFYTDAF